MWPYLDPLMLWGFNNGEIQLLLYDCQLLGLREAILYFVKQLAQGADVECVVLVHRLFVWLLNLGNWQGLPNCGEGGETSIRPFPPPNSNYPFLRGSHILKLSIWVPSPSFVLSLCSNPILSHVLQIPNLVHA